MRSIAPKHPDGSQTTEDLHRRLQDAERRLQLGQKLALHALRLDQRLQLGKRLPEPVQAWLERDVMRWGLWLEICTVADTDGAFEVGELRFFNALTKPQKTAAMKFLVEQDMLERTGRGQYRILGARHA